MYTCTPEEDCFCEKPQVEISMTACLVESGCSFNDRLAATKFRADTCGQRVHNRGPILSAVTYTMYGLATVFTMARGLSRSKTLGGSGFGLDDHTAFVAYVVLTAMAAGDWYAIHNGEGRYIYTLNANSVSLFLMVRRKSRRSRECHSTDMCIAVVLHLQRFVQCCHLLDENLSRAFVSAAMAQGPSRIIQVQDSLSAESLRALCSDDSLYDCLHCSV